MSTAKIHQQIHLAAPSWLTKVIQGHFYALILLLPLIFWLDVQTVFTLPKLAVFQLLSLSASLFLTFQLFLTGKITFHWQKSYLFLVFWLFSLILSTLFTLNLHTSLFGQYGRFMGFFTLANFLFLAVFLDQVFSRKDLPKLLSFSIVIASLVAIFGLLQYFNFFGLWIGQINWTDSPQNRVFSTIGHANHLGGYLAAILSMLLFSGLFHSSIASQSASRYLRYAASILLCLLLFSVLVLTASRGALLAILLTLLLLGILVLKKNWSSFHSRWHKIIAGILIVLGLIFSAIYFSWNGLESLGLLKRTEQTVETLNKGQIPDRLSFFYSALSMFSDHPILGTGLSTFRDAYNHYRRADYYIDGPGNAQYLTTPEAAHNEYVNILATQGIVGFLAYLGLIIYIIFQLAQSYWRSKPHQGYLYLSLLGGFLAFLIQTFFNFAEIVNLGLFYSLIGAFLISRQSPHDQKLSLQLKFLPKILLTLFLLISLIGTFFWYWLPELKTDYFLRRASVAENLHRAGLAQTNWQNALLENPSEYSIYQSLADFELQSGLLSTTKNDRENYFQKAARHYLQSLDLNENYPSTYHNLALTYLELFHSNKIPTFAELSKQYYQKSIEKSPNNPRYLYEYARKLHSDWNDRLGAVKLLKKAREIAPSYQEPQDYLNFLYKNHPELIEQSK